MAPKDMIASWFAKTGGGSLMLPDGWYGRPFDNVHVLDAVSERSEGLELALDNRAIVLEFKGLSKVRIDGPDLVIGPSLKLEFRSPSAPIRSFEEGTVVLKSLADK